MVRLAERKGYIERIKSSSQNKVEKEEVRRLLSIDSEGKKLILKLTTT